MSNLADKPSSFCLAPLYKNDSGLFPLEFFLGRPITVLSAPFGLPLFLILNGSLIVSNPGGGMSRK